MRKGLSEGTVRLQRRYKSSYHVACGKGICQLALVGLSLNTYRGRSKVIQVAYPEPTPVVKGKAAKQLIEDLRNADKAPRKKSQWAGSREVYHKLRPKSES